MKRQHRYEPVGVCIYCRKEPPTSDEHIIARGLGGALILPDASCPSCAKTTSMVEDHCQTKMYASLRRQFRLPTYHKKRKRPARKLEVDGVEQAVADDDFPGLVVALTFPAPSALGLTPDAPEVLTGGVAVGMLPEFGERLNRVRKAGREVSFRSGLEASKYGRMLAKIGHAYAVAELGLDGFEPWLPPFILGDDPPYIGKVVGGAMTPAGDGSDLHAIGLDTEITPDLAVVHLRLFTDRDLPSYWIVAGRRR